MKETQQKRRAKGSSDFCVNEPHFQTKSLGDSAVLLWSQEQGLAVLVLLGHCFPSVGLLPCWARRPYHTAHWNLPVSEFKAARLRYSGQQLLRPPCRIHHGDTAFFPLTHWHPQQSGPASRLRLHQAEGKSCLAYAIFTTAVFPSSISAIAVRFINTEMTGCHFYLYSSGY